MKEVFCNVTLLEKPASEGLNRSEIIDLYDMNTGLTVYPIELEARKSQGSACGFISLKAAELLGFDYETSGFHDFIASILDDMENENDDEQYEYSYHGKTISVYLGR